MKIYFILKNCYPNGKASVARVRCYTKGFKSHGIDTEILLPVSSERYGVKPINTETNGYDKNGVRFRYMSGSPLRKSNIFLRQINDIYGYINTLWHILHYTKKGDIIIVYEGGVLWHRMCAWAAHVVGIPVAMELNELPFGTGHETKKTKYQRLKMLTKVFPQYNFFFAISETLAGLVREYAPQAKVLKVPIIVEQNMDNYDWHEDKKPLFIFHSGTLYEQKDGILGMLEAFGIAVQQLSIPIYYYFTGRVEDSPHCEAIKEIIKKYHIENKIFFLGYIDSDTLKMYQKNCYLTIINKYETLQNLYCFSTKLGEYLAFSKPVIITSVGEAMQYLKNGINAYIVPPHQPELIAQKIIEAVNNPSRNKKIGDNAHKLVEKEFNCDYQTGRIIKMLRY